MSFELVRPRRVLRSAVTGDPPAATARRWTPSSRLPAWVWGGWNDFLGTVRVHPLLFFPLLRLRMLLPDGPRWPLLTAETELVIEGYWRSGNTFAAAAFASAQGRPTRLAYHTHAAATIRRAVRLGKPVLVLARPPLEAASGRLFLAPRVTPEHALREYVRFYRAVEPFAPGFVRATFGEVVADYGAVVERINARFGTAFRLPSRDGHSTADAPAARPRTCRTWRRSRASSSRKRARSSARGCARPRSGPSRSASTAPTPRDRARPRPAFRARRSRRRTARAPSSSRRSPRPTGRTGLRAPAACRVA